MLLIQYVGHIGLSSLTDGHLGRHLEYFKTLNDARVASVEFINHNASTTRINKEKNFKIKFQVILVFYRTTKAQIESNIHASVVIKEFIKLAGLELCFPLLLHNCGSLVPLVGWCLSDACLWLSLRTKYCEYGPFSLFHHSLTGSLVRPNNKNTHV